MVTWQRLINSIFVVHVIYKSLWFKQQWQVQESKCSEKMAEGEKNVTV